VIVGANEIGMSFYEMISKSSQFGYQVVGFIDAIKPVHLNGMYKGTLAELDKIISETDADEVIVAMDKFEEDQLDEIIRVNEKLAVRTRIIPDYFRFNSSRFSVEMFGKYPIVTVRHEPLDYLHWRVLKRAFDIVFSLLVCALIFSWLFPIIAILIKLDSKGPILFVQERWGRGSKPIRCFKFRSMRVNAPDMDTSGKFMQAGQDDPRITPMGKFLRKSNFDELPQFLNVIMGDMSVVGLVHML
jgi:putative colanic acid biosynthesis UDP-glucose lipid carrier transferase